jgi:two-component system, OmpR family, KDP operon response regulator KdpE
MTEHARILVVDDEAQITRVLRTTLSSHRYDVRVAADGDIALEIMKDWSPDLVITDLHMPNKDGLTLCKEIRLRSQMPIIVLSVKEDEQSKVKALDLGADDYVTKPFNMNELLARVRSNLRRAPAAEPVKMLDQGDFLIDLEGHIVTVRGREVRLTPKEFDLLVYLAQRPGKVVQHRALLAAVWGPESTEQPEYLRVFVGQLRKKVESEPNSPRYIITEPWIGYRFLPEGDLPG